MTPNLTAAYAAAPSPEAWLTILPVAILIVTGAALTMLRRSLTLHAPIAIATLGVLVVLNALLLHHVATEGPLTMVMGRWLPPFGIAFTVDLLGAIMALSASIVALAAGLYALREIDTNHTRYGFYPLLLFLTAGVTGAFLTGDIFNLYVWFEVLLIASFGLLVLGGEPGQIDGALKYGLLNLVGTTLFLIATGYLYAVFGTLNMADIASKVAKAAPGLPLMTLASLFFSAFAMKAAAFPVNFWLGASYHTPRTAVSALFAGLMTKVGVYAMIRVLVMLMPVEGEALRPLIAVVAILTLVTGGVGAIGVSDIRRVLGFWVITGIGVMLCGLAIGGATAMGAAVFYMLHSMVVMTALYFLFGMVGRLSGGFELAGLGGVANRSPWLAGLGLILLFAVSSLPPFSGFWPKAILVREALAAGHGWLAGAILLSGFLITFAAGRIFLLAFWRPGSTSEGALPPIQLGAVAVLAGLSLAVGLWPEPVAGLGIRAANGLIHPEAYIRSVFPGGRP
jgi:multicomponent Na+:H+ antiporter subunit D